MPGSNTSLQSPGRSAPVRGVASQQPSSSFTTPANAAPLNVMNTSTTPPHQQHHYTYDRPASNHPQGWNRPYSSGLPAPAVAVPIFRAARASDMSAARLPDSPPDTPPHSPGLRPVRLTTLVQPQRISPPRYSTAHERMSGSSIRTVARDGISEEASVDPLYTGETPCDTELESNADTDFSDASQATIDQLTQAAQSLQVHVESSRTKSQPLGVTAHRHAGLSAELMPATPEISPDNNVRHHAQKSAHAFLHSVFADVPSNLSIEDAGVELVSPGWSGAVIKSGPTSDPTLASSSFSSECSSDSSADTQRTLYVSMPPVVDATLLREQVLAVLDAASEKLGCDSVMVCLDRAMRDFASVLHGLCYVGGALVAAAKEVNGKEFDERLGGGQNRLPDTDPISELKLRKGLVLVAIEL